MNSFPFARFKGDLALHIGASPAHVADRYSRRQAISATRSLSPSSPNWLACNSVPKSTAPINAPPCNRHPRYVTTVRISRGNLSQRLKKSPAQKTQRPRNVSPPDTQYLHDNEVRGTVEPTRGERTALPRPSDPPLGSKIKGLSCLCLITMDQKLHDLFQREGESVALTLKAPRRLCLNVDLILLSPSKTVRAADFEIAANVRTIFVMPTQSRFSV